jgi:hypothetical protein
LYIRDLGFHQQLGFRNGEEESSLTPDVWQHVMLLSRVSFLHRLSPMFLCAKAPTFILVLAVAIIEQVAGWNCQNHEVWS